MKILLATSELHPYSKTGGLADMVGALGKFLARAGHRVGVVTPLYAGIMEKFPGIKKFDWKLNLPLGDRWVAGEVFICEPAENLTIYFIAQPEYYFRRGIYEEKHVSYPDNPERFLFLSKAAVHLAHYLPWRPEIVHVHDWQTALVPLLIAHQKSREGWWDAPKTCLTIHNLAYQGIAGPLEYVLTNLPPDYYHPHGAEFHGAFNFLKAGIEYADLITTVSPRYAREITTEIFGCRLDGVLRRRQRALIGILNGVDYEEWNTTHNPFLKAPFSVDSLAGKAECKRLLQEEVGLPGKPGVPLFGNISRLADQKGVDIMLGALTEMLSTDMQFVQLGNGAPEFERGLQQLAARFPGKVAIRIGYDHGLSHRIEAGCDFFLMPSRFEPCGLNQMYSLRYGTIPIVRITGGLDDSVIDIAEDQEKANGIKFQEYSVRALAKSIRKALVLYENAELMQEFRTNAMRQNFSWERTADVYEAAYHQIVS